MNKKMKKIAACVMTAAMMSMTGCGTDPAKSTKENGEKLRGCSKIAF